MLLLGVIGEHVPFDEAVRGVNGLADDREVAVEGRDCVLPI